MMRKSLYFLFFILFILPLFVDGQTLFSYDFGAGSLSGWSNSAAAHIVGGGYNGVFKFIYLLFIELNLI
jgi:hypothetical protein